MSLSKQSSLFPSAPTVIVRPYILFYVFKSDARQRILSFCNIAIAKKISGRRSNGCDMDQSGKCKDLTTMKNEGSGTNWEMKGVFSQILFRSG